MAELDYAFLAEYAKVENNQLTVVGASYTHVFAPALPAHHLLFVAGRVRIAEAEDAPTIHVKIQSPGGNFELGVESSLSKAAARPYDGKVGLTFAVGMGVPLMEEGLYEVFLEVNGETARRLAFDIALASSEQ